MTIKEKTAYLCPRLSMNLLYNYIKLLNLSILMCCYTWKGYNWTDKLNSVQDYKLLAAVAGKVFGASLTNGRALFSVKI